MARRAVAAAEEFATAHDVIYATYFTSVLYGFRQEWETAADWSKRTIELASEHGLPYYELMGSHMLGAATATAGPNRLGLADHESRRASQPHDRRGSRPNRYVSDDRRSVSHCW